jgi:hypothetical protein
LVTRKLMEKLAQELAVTADVEGSAGPDAKAEKPAGGRGRRRREPANAS